MQVNYFFYRYKKLFQNSKMHYIITAKIVEKILLYYKN